jgi:3-oxosteroid 1-dehydrogenase
MTGADFDVIVLGTGAAGLTAAIAAHEHGERVGVFEKAATVGGTSAWSGGQIWIPNHPHPRGEGKSDSRAEAFTYIMALSHGLIDQAMAETFLDTGPEMIAFLEARTPVRFYAVPDFPDYHPEFPGGRPKAGARSNARPFHTANSACGATGWASRPIIAI